MRARIRNLRLMVTQVTVADILAPSSTRHTGTNTYER
jgi:hypothetical protein